MNILLIGGGGSEHALAWSLRKNPDVGTIWALPGNAGMEEIATCVPIAAKDLDAIVCFAQSHLSISLSWLQTIRLRSGSWIGSTASASHASALKRKPLGSRAAKRSQKI